MKIFRSLWRIIFFVKRHNETKPKHKRDTSSKATGVLRLSIIATRRSATSDSPGLGNEGVVQGPGKGLEVDSRPVRLTHYTGCGEGEAMGENTC
jgi:hypothetical protein